MINGEWKITLCKHQAGCNYTDFSIFHLSFSELESMDAADRLRSGPATLNIDRATFPPPASTYAPNARAVNAEIIDARTQGRCRRRNLNAPSGSSQTNTYQKLRSNTHRRRPAEKLRSDRNSDTIFHGQTA